ncbi:hypothetical protein [Nisaea sp.]|uniref:hypothetical protein n=1 Tax=Nisaea sp. TaxID=2024842 RepID=UPI0032974051
MYSGGEATGGVIAAMGDFWSSSLTLTNDPTTAIDWLPITVPGTRSGEVGSDSCVEDVNEIRPR